MGARTNRNITSKRIIKSVGNKTIIILKYYYFQEAGEKPNQNSMEDLEEYDLELEATPLSNNTYYMYFIWTSAKSKKNRYDIFGKNMCLKVKDISDNHSTLG